MAGLLRWRHMGGNNVAVPLLVRVGMTMVVVVAATMVVAVVMVIVIVMAEVYG